MRELSTIRGVWQNGAGQIFGDDQRSHARVTVEHQWQLNMTGQTVSTENVADSNDMGPYRYWYDSDHRSNETEVPNIASIRINSSIDKDSAECVISIYNQWHDTNTTVPSSPDVLGNPGYLGPNYGSSDIAEDTWGQTANSWSQVLVPNALIRTYQGYGGYNNGIPNDIDVALAAGNLALTGTWLVDSVQASTNGMLILKCRDMAKLLIDQMIYPPLVPDRYYPLKYYRYAYQPVEATIGVPGIPVVPGSDEDPDDDGVGAAAIQHNNSTVDIWYGNDAVIHGTRARNVWDDREDTYSISPGSIHWNRIWAKEWWEGTLSSELINQVYISPYGIPDNGAYSIWISIEEQGEWQGTETIAWDDADEDGISDSLAASGEEARATDVAIPFVAFVSLPNATEGEGTWFILPRVYRAQRIRITVAPQWNSPHGPYNYRAALRKVSARLVREDPAGQFGPVPDFIGESLSRGEFLASLYNFAGSPTGAASSPFTDLVSPRHIAAVDWAYENGITTGTTATTFTPDRAITRVELVTFLWRSIESPTGYPATPFTDLNGTWHNEPVEWAYAVGVTTGTTATTFDPSEAVKPDHADLFFQRFAALTFVPPSFWNIDNDGSDPIGNDTVIIPSPPIITDGNIRDWVDPVVDLLRWAGFLDVEDGGLHGLIEYSGAWPVNDLNEDVFDKKSIMDAINTVKEVLGYVFFVDYNGKVRFHSPNWWAPGNTDADGNRISTILDVAEEVVLTDYTNTWDDKTVRSEIIIGSSLLEDTNQTVQSVNVNPNLLTSTDLLRGMVRPAIWINEVWTDQGEQALMAALIGLHLLFQSRKGRVSMLANPEIEINDQVRIFERTTSEAYIHYVRGVSSSHNLDTGEYTMTLETNWLGEGNVWAFDRDALFQLFGLSNRSNEVQGNYEGGMQSWLSTPSQPTAGDFDNILSAFAGSNSTGGFTANGDDPGGDNAGTGSPAFGTWERPFASDSVWYQRLNETVVSGSVDGIQYPDYGSNRVPVAAAALYTPQANLAASEGNPIYDGDGEASRTVNVIDYYDWDVSSSSTGANTFSWNIPFAATGATDTGRLIVANGNQVLELIGASWNGSEWDAVAGGVQTLDGDGLAGGFTSAGLSTIAGVVRGWELDQGVIRHRIALALPSDVLRNTDPEFRWPANEAGDTPYRNVSWGGRIGDCYAIPKTTYLSSLGLASGTGRVLARALQDYGGHVVDVRDSTTVAYFDIEASGTHSLPSADAAIIANALRRVTSVSESTPEG